MVQTLPIDSLKVSFFEHFKSTVGLLVLAEPGAGKTTRVPFWVAQAHEDRGEKRPLMLALPRRSVVTAMVQRFRELEPGARIGFESGWGSERSREDTIVCVTYGVLQQRLMRDPLLEDFRTVICDEIHERSIEMDACLSALKEISTLREDVSVVLMSATTDASAWCRWWDGLKVLESQGRVFPVEQRYVEARNRNTDLRFDCSLVARATRELYSELSLAAEQSLGNVSNHAKDVSWQILVFCPGQKEVWACVKALEDLPTLPLFGAQSRSEQLRALAYPSTSRIVVATNIAESALTLPNVAGVVDSGLEKEARFDIATEATRLVLRRISIASANQRAGRAGRVRTGVCIRVWPEHEMKAMSPYREPEVKRADPRNAILLLRRYCGETLSETTFPTPIPPRLKTWAEASLTTIEAELKNSPRMEAALNAGFQLDALQFVDRALEYGMLDFASTWLTLAQENFRQERESLNASFTGRGQLKRRLSAHEQKLKSRLLRRLETLSKTFPMRADVNIERELQGVEELLVRGHLQSVAKRVRERRYQRFDGVQVRVPEGIHQEWILVLALQRASASHGGTLWARSIWEIESLDVPALLNSIVVKGSVAQVDSTGRCRVFEQKQLGKIKIARRELEKPNPLLIDEALRTWWSENYERQLKLEGASKMFLGRYKLVRERCDSELPQISESDIANWVLDYHSVIQSVQELLSTPIMDLFNAHVDYRTRARIDELAPRSISNPYRTRQGKLARRDFKIDYDDPSGEPVLSARIQHLFLFTQHPYVLGGRLALRVQLLAPNMRPAQVTRDLPAFWQGSYQEVRKELRGRYPKHYWPDRNELQELQRRS